MAYFNFEMEMENGSIHWPDIEEIVEFLRYAADHIEQNNGAFLEGIDGTDRIVAACDVTDTCTGTLKLRRELKAREEQRAELFKQATA